MIPADKIKHFGVGVTVYALAYAVGIWAGAMAPCAFLFGVVVTAGVAGLKEYWDHLGHGTPDISDFWVTVWGAFLGALILTLFPFLL